VRARRRDDGGRFAAPHHRPGKHRLAGRPGELARFAGERRLVDAQLALEQAQVRGYEVAGAQPHHVLPDQLARRGGAPGAVAQHAARHLQAPAQRRHGGGSAAFLEEGEDRIDDEQRSRHREIDVFVQHQRQHDDRLDHPGREAPELERKLAQRVPGRLGDLVRALRLEPRARLRARQPCAAAVVGRIHARILECVSFQGLSAFRRTSST